MSPALRNEPRVGRRDIDLRAMRAEFRDRHGRALAGFATMLVLGDRPRAEVLAAETLARGAARISELRDPERATAVLREDLVRHAGRDTDATAPDRESILAALGATPSIIRALTALNVRERAAIIAADIEHLPMSDVERIVGRRPGATARLLRHARARFTAAFDELGVRHGEIARAVKTAAEGVGHAREKAQ